jgi:hypothetical protein
VDHVKFDGVGASDIADVQAWSTALKQTGRPIWLELSNDLPIADASTWHSLANGWRTTGDIECYSCWAPPYYASSHVSAVSWRGMSYCSATRPGAPLPGRQG